MDRNEMKIKKDLFRKTRTLKGNSQNRGITLIALVVTIILLLILAGIAISSLGGENGLISKVNQAKKAQIKAEMREQLVLVLSELQVEKEGNATLDDVTQEWADNKLEDYEPTIIDDVSTEGKKIIMSKSGVIGKYIIDENLNIVETEETTGAELTYEVKSRDGENLQVVVTVTDNDNGLQIIEYDDGHIQEANGLKNVSRDCTLQLGVEYKVKITSKSGEVKTETILINDYYHSITKNLSEGISIDNVAVKTAYNQPYQATLTIGNEYILDTFTVTMGGEEVTVDKTTGIINIEKVTGDIEIIATVKKLEIEVTEAIIGTKNPPSSSVDDNSQTRGDKLYIFFSAILEENQCEITPSLPYEITTNGTYIFVATGTYNGKNITKDIEIQVNKYEAATGLVQYDAGNWTADEISQLETKSLYNENVNKIASSEVGLNFTFGGFKVGTSRNNSVSPGDGYGTPKYEGWQILESEQNNGKTYVTKLVHTGSPENFVYEYTKTYDAYRVEYILSSGERFTTYNTYEARNWDMYIDQNQKDLVDNVHAMKKDEANETTVDCRATGAYYWLASALAGGGANASGHMLLVDSKGNVSDTYGSFCFGIRPVVEMVDGVYIASGTGTEGDPFVLGKE